MWDENLKTSFGNSLGCLVEAMKDPLSGTRYFCLHYIRQEDSEFQNSVSDLSSVNQKQLKRQEPWRTVFLHMYLFSDKCVCLKV